LVSAALDHELSVSDQTSERGQNGGSNHDGRQRNDHHRENPVMTAMATTPAALAAILAMIAMTLL